jgi:hypothetical protein
MHFFLTLWYRYLGMTTVRKHHWHISNNKGIAGVCPLRNTTIDELQVIVRAFVCAIFIKFLSLLDSRRKYSISKNLECSFVCIDT